MKFYVKELASSVSNPAKEIKAKNLTEAKRIAARKFKGDIQIGMSADSDMMIDDLLGERIDGEWEMY